MPGGRPSKYDPELANEICANLAKGLTEEMACAISGISDRTFQKWKKKPEFLRLRAKVEGARVQGYLKRFDDAKDFLELKRCAWMLKRRWPERFARRRDLIVNQIQNGLPAQQQQSGAVDPALLEKLSARMEKCLAIERK